MHVILYKYRQQFEFFNINSKLLKKVTFKKLLTVLLVGMLGTKVTTADSYRDNDNDLCKNAESTLCLLSSLARSIARIANNLATGACKTEQDGNCAKLPVVPAVVDKCQNLKDGQQYYLKTFDGKYAVVDAAKQLGFVKQIGWNSGSKFTATKVGCNSYGLCVDGSCMSRCNSCKSDTGELNTVKFHLKNSNEPYSRWTFVSTAGNGVGEYNLKIDGPYGYLTYKKTPSGDYQLSLSTQLSNETKFQFIRVDQ